MTNPSIAIVTGANASHFPLAMDMFRSLSAQTTRELHLCCLDVGLEADQSDTFAGMGIKLVEPGWDYPGEFPAPWFRALSARPHLQRYFPGHDFYIWIDADCWLQNDRVLETFIAGATSHDVAVATCVHHDYRQVIAVSPDKSGPPVQLYYAYLMQSLFKPDIAAKMLERPYLNAGVFALRAGSPVWETWRQVLGPLYERARSAKQPSWARQNGAQSEGMWKNLENKVFFHSEEVALNFAAWQANPAILDATCNWLCSQRLPALNAQGRLVAPGFQAAEIGIIHLTAQTKELEFQIKRHDGSLQTMSLRYPHT